MLFPFRPAAISGEPISVLIRRFVSQPDPAPWGRSKWVFRGYLHYGKVLVGSWRGMTTDARSIPWEGPFVASKRIETVAS